LPGWPAPPPPEPQEAAGSEQSPEEIAAPLVRRGWLLEAQPDASGLLYKTATPVVAPTPEAELSHTTDPRRAKLRLRTVVAFVVASVLAKFVLRFWRFERVIERVAGRKSRRLGHEPLDHERLRELLDAFDRLRVFLFSSREECLHDSLAVIEFLAQHGVFPAWVFGVRARPFIAHCWVQSGGFVCNDTVEHVSTYVPIMVV
jgi:hypothetical protein